MQRRKALCAYCLKNGKRTEETAAHLHHKCPKAAAIWKKIVEDWNEKTGDSVVADLTASVAGLRTCPDGVTGETRREWEACEPAWRLLHAVTLQEIYRARCRTHAAFHLPCEPTARPEGHRRETDHPQDKDAAAAAHRV